jgi:heme-degrading monooxygenase HmoA
MQARVARYAVPPERWEEASEAFVRAGQELAQVGGLEKGYILVDPADGCIVTVTLWESQAALDASEVRAAGLRQRAAKEVDGEVQSVIVCDVVREFS